MYKTIKNVIIVAIILCSIVVVVFTLKIQHIEVNGNNKLSDIEIASSIFEKETDKSVLIFWAKEKFGKHKKINFVNDYYVRWVSPFSIIIDVHEKPSIAYVRRDLKNVYFDKDGIINDITETKDPKLLEVIGVNFKKYEKGTKLEAKDMRIVNAIINISSSIYDNKLPAKYLEIAQNGEMSVFIGNVTVLLGDTKNIEIKLQRLSDIYGEISDLKGTLDLSNASENMLDEQYIFKKSE